jgi:DUF4097 and DUF4098 domain-containing protein YvlB
MKGARVADSIGWSNILESLARDQRIRRHIRLALNDELEAPITAGWINPVILLPCDADTWTPERKHVVLVHELAHVARGDYAAQLVATFVLAVLWFHPLVWLAVARLRTEAEQAADDRVLASGVAGVNYATHLLEIARSASRIQLAAAVAVGMARSSRMERRFRSMLDPRRSRRALRGRTFTLAALASMSVVAPLACVRTVARATPKLANDARTERVVTAALSSPSVPEPPSPNATAPSARPSLPRSTDDRTSASDSIVDKTIDAASGGRVRLVLPTGGGVIVHGWDSSRVRVRTELGGSDWRLVRIALDRTGGDVRVRSTFVDAGTHSTELWFEIWIPRRSDVDLASAGGSVEIDDVNGKLVGETGGGSIVIRHAKGFASLSTGGGEIDVSESDLGGQVSTGWGPIYLRNVTGGLSGVSPSSRYVSSTSAATWPAPFTSVSSVASNRSPTTTNSTIGSCVAVSVGSPSVMTTTRDDTAGPRLRATGPLTLVKPGGSIDIASAPSGATLSTGGGHIVVEQSNKTVVASTGGGDIQLLRASGDATASTGAGDVTISVVNTDGAMHDINVCDGHGRVILELPAELDATLELETAYTDQFGRRTNIESDVPVERSETTEWDDRYGTPRKFVRAVGKSGSGAGMIRVHTVNGDIVVRRR